MTDSTLAIVFPGQGSQSVGMMADLADNISIVKHTFSEASDVLGYDLWSLIQKGPEELLNQTDKTQPAMLASGVAAWRALQEKGGATPALMAGHSLGEYTALVCAGALDFATAVKLVEERGQRMQAAVPAGTGAMAAILGLDDDQVRAVCEAAAEGDVVSPVNFNSPGQVVIAGQKAAVERAIVGAKEAGAKRALPLPVSVPSHCSLMKPAAEDFADSLHAANIQLPSIPVIQNADVVAHDSVEGIRDGLMRQLYSPVRWVETIQAMSAQGVTRLVEAGPGKVLVGLNKRIDKAMTALPVFDTASLEAAL